MLKRTAIEVTGGLSRTSKMPGKSFGLSANDCNVGSKLAKVPGSVCEDCYARKGCYQWDSVKDAHQRRLDALNHPDWIPAMVRLIEGETWFRWHDSGDIRNMDHLHAIVEVCNRTPDTNHWLPTKEYHLIRRYIRENGSFPSNLVVRVSAPMIDRRPPQFKLETGVRTSTVHKDFPPYGVACQSDKHGGKCGPCRACWDADILNVSYKKH